MALALLTGCAAEPPPPAETPEPAPPAAVLPATPEPAPAAAEPEAPKPAAAPAPPPEPERTGPTRPATEILLDSDADFLLDDGASALKEAARQKCEGEAAGSDPKELQSCMQKERDAFSGDVVTFQKTPNGIRLTVYRRRGSRLDEVYTAPVELQDQSPTTVLVKLKGFKGARPFLQGQKEFSVGVPDNYSLVLEDPNLGKLVYRVKVGLVTR